MYYKHHIFFCLNERTNGEECCAHQGAKAGFDRCKQLVKQAGLSGPGKVRVNKSGCLDRCAAGPVVVVYRSPISGLNTLYAATNANTHSSRLAGLEWSNAFMRSFCTTWARPLSSN